jgi:hypothetical protein
MHLSRNAPKTKDDWCPKMPQQSRAIIDSEQVGKYLDRVLQLIAESDDVSA